MNLFRSSIASLPFFLSCPALVAQQPNPAPTDAALLASHYERVERELAGRDVSDLSAEARAERNRLIGLLREYRQRADFGVNTDFPGQRMLYFVDRSGRRCAVANLLDHSGMGSLTDRVARDHNHAWVAELAQDAEFTAWLQHSGLTLAEAARIQGPSIRNQPPPPPPPVYDGPEDVNTPPTPGTSGPSASTPGSPRPGGPSTGGTPRGQRPTAPTTGGRTPRGIPITGMGSPDWVMWWTWNRHTYLRPNRLPPSGPITGPTGTDDGDAALRYAQQSLLPILRRQSADSNGDVRFQAVLALGRVGGTEAVSRLLEMLDDPNRIVRHGAVLALGATGSPRASHALLHIARSGTAPGRNRKIGAWARPLALAGLGLNRRYGDNTPLARMVAQLARTAEGAQRDHVRTAAFVYHELAGERGVPTLTSNVLAPRRDGKKDPLETRCQATEALAHGRDKASLVKLFKLMSGAQIQERRSAATALGQRPDVLALQPLQTAFEMEKEPLARGFLLISIGTIGGDAARDFLLEQLRTGRKTLRPWSALALGVLARDEPDGKIITALRKTLARDRNHDNHGAYLIACGLARDPEALELMARMLNSSASGTLRKSAAEGLALLGSVDAHRAVRARIEEEQCAFVRAGLVEALGYFGRVADADLLAQIMREETNPDHQVSAAAALGLHGSWKAHRILVDVAQDDDMAAAVRGTALESLGMMLADHPAYGFASVGAQSNFAAFPDWLRFGLATTL